jgi:hypothetical protein
MTLQADPGVKLVILSGCCIAEGCDLMQIMAVMTGSGIGVSVEDCLAVKGGHISLGKIMAIAASGNDFCFVLFPGLMHMDIGVAIKALDVIEHMNATVMLGRLFFMTTDALDRARHLLAVFVAFQIRNFQMATGTAVLAVDRIGKVLHVDDFVMTFETFLGINGYSVC